MMQQPTEQRMGEWIIWQLISYSPLTWTGFVAIALFAAWAGGRIGVIIGHFVVAVLVVARDLHWIRTEMQKPEWDGQPDQDIVFMMGVMMRIVLITSRRGLHRVEEFFLHNLPVFHSVERGFFHLHAMIGHRADFGGHVVGEMHDKAIAMRPGAGGLAAMHGVVIHPHLILPADGFNPLHPRGHAGHGHQFKADDIGGVKRIDGFEILALIAECDELLADFERGGDHIELA